MATEITKEQFEDAYRNFLPSKIESFYIKNTLAIYSLYRRKWLAIIICAALLIPFILGILFYVCKLPHIFIDIQSFIYSIILAYISINWFIIWQKRKKRYEKIRNFLGVSKKEFQEIINIHYCHTHIDTDTFIKQHTH